jgi:hypothetical protein
MVCQVSNGLLDLMMHQMAIKDSRTVISNTMAHDLP